jgi:hypothetical protein
MYLIFLGVATIALYSCPLGNSRDCFTITNLSNESLPIFISEWLLIICAVAHANQEEAGAQAHDVVDARSIDSKY